jgi:glutamate/tyrosine decarboxylase-like PLP-dependent enzyme
LQQSALKKHLSLDDFRMFIDEVSERAAILADGLETEPQFEIVRDVTGEWFADLLDEMLDTAARL